MTLGEKICKLRKKQGLSQEELGERLDVTRQTISNWENNETSPNPEQLKVLSKELNISIDELLDNDLKDIIIEKVSNTEILAGLILKIIKILLFAIPILFIIILAIAVVYKNIRQNKSNSLYREKSIYCMLYGEEHSYSITYEELTGSLVSGGGDSYFYDILELNKYDDVNQIFNIINDYVKKNGGTCTVVEENDISEIVSMSIKEGSLSRTEATVVIEEVVDYNISYGSAFWIEKYNYETNKYKKLKSKDGCGFTMQAYGATANKPLELYQNWSCMYGELANGTYRIVKEATFDTDIPITDDDIFYIYTDFVIE